MLDDLNVLNQRDSEKTLDSSTTQPEQLSTEIKILHTQHDNRTINSVVFVGMGGSALAPEFVQTWCAEQLRIPFEIVRNYQLPAYVNENTLVIVSSCSGNTEVVLQALEFAKETGAQLAAIAGGGALAQLAEEKSIAHIILPPIKVQPRMLTFIQVRALIQILELFGVLDATPLLQELESAQSWLQDNSKGWYKEVPTSDNYAKQIALLAAGKTPIFYGGQLTKSIAYKWKISWNENAKNTAFCNQYPEFNHNEFIGWSSHPIEKPFAVFDVISSLENPRILKRFEISDRLLSGQRPKAVIIKLSGESLLRQLLWGHLLGDFASIYAGILNGVDPGPVPLVTKLKQELVN